MFRQIQAIIEAVRFLFYRMKLVVEPSGALGPAALLSRAAAPRGFRSHSATNRYQ